MRCGKFGLVVISLVVLYFIVSFLVGRSEKPPTIEGIDPWTASASGGTKITINGTGFHADPAPIVTIGGNPASDVEVISKTSIMATIPAGVAGLTDIVVHNADAKVESLPFTGFSYLVTAPETVTDIPPKTPSKQDAASVKAAEMAYIEKLGAKGRKAQEDFPKILEQILLSRGIDVYVTVTRPNHNTTMTIKAVLMSRPLMTIIMDEFISQIKSIGFAKVIFTTGERKIGTYDLVNK